MARRDAERVRDRDLHLHQHRPRHGSVRATTSPAAALDRPRRPWEELNHDIHHGRQGSVTASTGRDRSRNPPWAAGIGHGVHGLGTIAASTSGKGRPQRRRAELDQYRDLCGVYVRRDVFVRKKEFKSQLTDVDRAELSLWAKSGRDERQTDERHRSGY
jgi:hypothetical protein